MAAEMVSGSRGQYKSFEIFKFQDGASAAWQPPTDLISASL